MNIRQTFLVSVAAMCGVFLAAASAQAADNTRQQDTVQQQDQSRDRDRVHQDQDDSGKTVYGSQLMTQQERIDHRNQMRQAKTAEERERIRLEHHKQMQERAREQNVTLPDMPPTHGMGGGMGNGMGGGMGGGRGGRR